MSKSLRAYLLQKGKKVLDELLLPVKEKKDKHALDGWLLKKEEEISELTVEILTEKAKDPLNPDAILDAVDALEIAQARLIQGEELKKELFEMEVDENGIYMKEIR
jgi:hypothetical protein